MSEENELPAGLPKPGSKRTLIIVVVAINVLVLGGGAAWMFAARGSNAQASHETSRRRPHGRQANEHADAEDEEGEERSRPAGEFGPIIAFEPIVSNLKGASERFVKVTASFELRDEEDTERFEASLTPVRDNVLRIIGELTPEQALSSEERVKLRRDLREAANDALGEDRVAQVYFSEFVVQ